jgi:hypothetical protein
MRFTQQLLGQPRKHEGRREKYKHTNKFYTKEKWWVELFDTSHVTKLYASLATQHCPPTLLFCLRPSTQITHKSQYKIHLPRRISI